MVPPQTPPSSATLVMEREGLITWRNSESFGGFSEMIIFFSHAGGGMGGFDSMKE